jgi:hypothetical protein
MTGRLLLLVFVATALASSTRAQAPDTVKGQSAGAATSASDSAQPSISGVWFMHGNMVPSIVPAQDAPMLPWAQEKFKANKQEIDPELHCFPSGVPRIWVIPAPFEIIQVPGRVLIYYELQHLVRQIHLNRSTHPADLIPTFMGDSIGRWEGDTLVIDSIGFKDQTYLDISRLPHTDALHVIERIRLASKDQLEVGITIDDPKAYSRPMTATRIYDRKPGWEIGEWICEENNTYIGVNTPPAPEK